MVIPHRGFGQRQFPGRRALVAIRVNKQTQIRRIRIRNGRRFVLMSVRGFDCGVYPVTIRAGGSGSRPAKRIVILRGGNRVERFVIGNPGTRPTP